MSEEGRALLTDREKEIISGEADVSDNYRYKTESIVRNRIRKHLRKDIEFLEEHFDEAYELAIEGVCEDSDPDQETIEEWKKTMHEAANHLEAEWGDAMEFYETTHEMEEYLGDSDE
ncbi:hypothetical protein [Natronobacterium gregoryi]|uniref:Uncharacterized protein n=3 Tax=Natronobacterium gregoryi TaxID=44930 RepID=L0AND3_NATGS|nr:hypothetical protein [Natronobacterium gregoryi]AFZ74585.1 hypothetical protein Natgr_3466 [Natronobacterium gregoryi SP2]ELY72591.1 hypothetical protein C490_03343 [Natronobacterium gregoryi SP2]SFJ29962.1 hypothetical protein SAMN05443661_1213 [Natronobacterium gregoryi]